MNDAAHEERARCVAICRRRADVWRKTADAGIAAVRHEARARANEAAYLADLLESGMDVTGGLDEPADA